MPWLIHELTHVWQYQQGVPTSAVILSAFKGNYDYGGEANLRKRWSEGESFGDFGTEQQGDILQDYYKRLVVGRDVSAYEPYVDQVRSGVWRYRLPPMVSIKELPLGTLDETALNEQYRKKVEAEIIGVLRTDIGVNDRRGIAARRDKVLELSITSRSGRPTTASASRSIAPATRSSTC